MVHALTPLVQALFIYTDSILLSVMLAMACYGYVYVGSIHYRLSGKVGQIELMEGSGVPMEQVLGVL